MQDLRNRFGQLVAAHRRTAGLTQEALALATGLSKDMVTRIEIGGTGTSFQTIQKLADALGVDPAELFTPLIASPSKGRPDLTAIIVKLSGLSSRDLAWVSGLIEAALRPH